MTEYKSKVKYEAPIEINIEEDFPDYGSMAVSEIENIICSAVLKVGITVDKEELIKALRYDRGQYEKGYADGKRDAMEALQVEQEKTVTQIFGEEQQEWEEYCTGLMNRIRELKEQLPKWGEIVRCGECKWYQPDLCANPWGVCFHEDWVANNIGHTVDEDGFCYRGERKVQE